METTGVEEGSFPNSSNNLENSTKRLAEWTFSLQGVGADLRQVVKELKAWVGSKMAHWSDENPPPDPEQDRKRLEDIVEAASRAAASALARRASVEIHSRHDERGPKNGNGSLSKWAMPGLVTLAVAGIMGNIAQAMMTSALRQQVADYVAATEKRLDRIEQKLFP